MRRLTILLLLAGLVVMDITAQLNYDEKLLPKEAVIPEYLDTIMPVMPATCQVSVDIEDTINHQVSSFIYGNNATAYQFNLFKDPDYNKEIKQNIRDLNPNILRWPGGSLSNNYFWDGKTEAWMEESGSPFSPWYGNNGSWWLSLDEYYQLLEQTNSTGCIVVNYGYARYGRSADPVAKAAGYAADWVRYDNGRTRYWEIGNEHFGNWEVSYEIDTEYNQDGQPQYQTADLYGRHCKVFIDSMRKAAAEFGHEIEIGVVMYESDGGGYTTLTKTWNQDVIPHVADIADFSSVHNYFGPYNTNSSADVILNTHDYTHEIKEGVENSFLNAGKEPLPTAMTEFNIWAVNSSQMISNVNGLHASLILGEMAANAYYLGTRWNLNNGYSEGNDHGMFAWGDPEIANEAPYADFFHMMYFQGFFGDKVVASQVQNSSDVVAFASAFSSGEAGVVLINKGTSEELVELDLQNFAAGERYYWYLLEPDGSAEFTRKLTINGKKAEQGWAGPRNYAQIKARSVLQESGKLKIELPGRTAAYILAEDQGGPRLISAKTAEQPGKLYLKFHSDLAEPLSVDGFTVYTDEDQVDEISSWEWKASAADSLTLILNKEIYPDKPIFLSYEGSSIQIPEGLPLLPFDSVEVENLLAGAAPNFLNAVSTEDGLQITISFSKEMADGAAPADFNVVQMDAPVTVEAVELAAPGSRDYLLSLSEPMVHGEMIYLSYSGTSALAADGGVLADFGPEEVTNNILPVPVVQEVSIEEYGYAFKIQFSESMVATGDLQTAFSLTQDGLEQVLISAILNGADLYFDLDQVLEPGTELLLNYLGGVLESDKGVILLSFENLTVENSLDFEIVALPAFIEAEDFAAESGIQLEPCVWGGLNIYGAEPGDWLEYEVQVAEAGTYTFNYHYAQADETGSFELLSSATDAVLHMVNPPTTYHAQNWDTIVQVAELPAGRQRLKMNFLEAGLNLNWFRIDKGDTRPSGIREQLSMDQVRIYPNPARDRLYVFSPELMIDELLILDLSGRVMLRELPGSQKLTLQLDLAPGAYQLILRSESWRGNRSLIIY